MKKTKFISFFLCQIIILSIISFSYIINAAEETKLEEEKFNPDNFIKEVKETPVGQLSDKIKEIKDLTQTNELLKYIGENINQEGFKELRETSEILTQKIISDKSGRELKFKFADNSKVEKLSIEEKDGKDLTLSIGVKGKNFQIPLSKDKLPEEIKGIEVKENGVSYKLNQEGTQEIVLDDPKYELIKQDGKLSIKNYKGLDDQEHNFEISFTDAGGISLKENGKIEISGGAKIYDSKTGTSFSLVDTKGKPGYINFYKEGHIVESIGNEIMVKKEADGLEIGIKNSKDISNAKVFILADKGLTKEFSSYPNGFDKGNSLLIDTEGKKIFIPENKESICSINGKDYFIFGNPNTPQGGVKLDGTKLYGNGGQIIGNASIGGGGGGSDGGNGGGGGGSDGGGGGGSINKLLPWLLIIGGIAAAIALIAALAGKKDDKKSSNGSSSSSNSSSGTNTGTSAGYTGEGYNDESKSELSTGKSAPPITEKRGPTIQSPYT